MACTVVALLLLQDALVVLKISFAGMKTQDTHKDTDKGYLSLITYPILYPSPQPIPDISLNKVGPSQGYVLFSPGIYHT